MFNLWRDKGSTAEEKSQEMLSAYLDNALTPDERQRFEAQLARDPDLRAELQQLQAIKLQMRSMPRRRVPRSFALDPALYGRPKSQPLLQMYPVLRGATALTAFLLISTLALGLFRGEFAPAAQAPLPAAGIITSSEAIQEAAPAAADMAAGSIEMAATAIPEARESAPGEGEMGLAAETTEQEAPESNLTAESLPIEGAPDALATMDVAVAPEAELQAHATEAVPLLEEAPPAATAIAEAVPYEEPAPTPPAVQSPLRAIQIALAIAFVILLVFFLLARRQLNRL